MGWTYMEWSYMGWAHGMVTCGTDTERSYMGRTHGMVIHGTQPWHGTVRHRTVIHETDMGRGMDTGQSDMG